MKKKENIKKEKSGYSAKQIAGLAVRILIAAAIIITVIINYNRLVNIDVQALVEGKNDAAATGVILGVYLLKSVLFVIPASIVYTAVGVAYKWWKALIINAVGIIIEVSVTWLLGRILGGETVEKIIRKSKKGEKLLNVKNSNKYSVIFGIRVLPVFPIDFVSLFLGAARMKFLPYLLLSFAGIMPRVTLFTVLGASIFEYIPMQYIIIFAVCAVCAALVVWVVRYAVKMKKKFNFVPAFEGKEIILDTDIGPDCDDAGAIAVMCSLLKEKGRKPLGVVNCTSNKNSDGAVRALLDFCGCETVPAARTQRKDFLANDSKYTPVISEKYLGKNKKINVEKAVDFYREKLKNAEDDSVILVTIGMLNNISDLIEKEKSLVKKKVHALVVMGACFPEGREFNIYKDTQAAKNVFENFPKPIICSGFEIGADILTGFNDIPENAGKNPIYESYSIYVGDKKPVRSSWDLTTVQFAIEGESEYYKIKGPVKMEIAEDGSNKIIEDKNGNVYYLDMACKKEKIEAHLNSLLRGYDTVK